MRVSWGTKQVYWNLFNCAASPLEQYNVAPDPPNAARYHIVHNTCSMGGVGLSPRYSSPVASLVLTDSSQLTSDSQHLVAHYSSPMASLVLTDSSQLTAWKSYQTKLCIPTPNHMICKNRCLAAPRIETETPRLVARCTYHYNTGPVTLQSSFKALPRLKTAIVLLPSVFCSYPDWRLRVSAGRYSSPVASLVLNSDTCVRNVTWSSEPSSSLAIESPLRPATLLTSVACREVLSGLYIPHIGMHLKQEQKFGLRSQTCPVRYAGYREVRDQIPAGFTEEPMYGWSNGERVGENIPTATVLTRSAYLGNYPRHATGSLVYFQAWLKRLSSSNCRPGELSVLSGYVLGWSRYTPQRERVLRRSEH
uniref:Uncharacterized protein n=1 Tax=Timema douglasi TaxID=61478 RepID=A0A7R8Z385_TIMDO|nr:unnamed protein product [Timema douglasi]